jgi:hypothetical protein
MISCLSFKPPLVLQTQEASAGAAVPFDLKIFSPGTDKDEIYALRYRAFIEAGLIPARADRRFSDAYDDLDTTTTIAAFDGTACVGTFRLAFGREGGAHQGGIERRAETGIGQLGRHHHAGEFNLPPEAYPA